MKDSSAFIDNDTWDLIIQPKAGLFNFNLKEIWKYRDLVWLFVKRDFTAQYKQTVLGPLWHLIQPIFTTLIFVIVFSKIANIPTDGIQPTLFYLSGIILWNYFAGCLTTTSSTFITNAGIFGKVYFPRLVMPLSAVLSNIVKLGIQFLLLMLMILYFYFKGNPIHVSVTWLIIPLLVVMMASLGLAIGILISSLTTKYRDLNILISFAIQLLMYATPIAYPLSYLQNKSYASWIRWNPLTPIVEAFRYALFGNGTFTLNSLLYSTSFILIALFTGLIFFNRIERSFMDTV